MQQRSLKPLKVRAGDFSQAVKEVAEKVNLRRVLPMAPEALKRGQEIGQWPEMGESSIDLPGCCLLLEGRVLFRATGGQESSISGLPFLAQRPVVGPGRQHPASQFRAVAKQVLTHSHVEPREGGLLCQAR